MSRYFAVSDIVFLDPIREIFTLGKLGDKTSRYMYPVRQRTDCPAGGTASDSAFQPGALTGLPAILRPVFCQFERYCPEWDHRDFMLGQLRRRGCPYAFFPASPPFSEDVCRMISGVGCFSVVRRISDALLRILSVTPISSNGIFFSL